MRGFESSERGEELVDELGRDPVGAFLFVVAAVLGAEHDAVDGGGARGAVRAHDVGEADDCDLVGVAAGVLGEELIEMLGADRLLRLHLDHRVGAWGGICTSTSRAPDSSTVGPDVVDLTGEPLVERLGPELVRLAVLLVARQFPGAQPQHGVGLHVGEGALDVSGGIGRTSGAPRDHLAVVGERDAGGHPAAEPGHGQEGHARGRRPSR